MHPKREQILREFAKEGLSEHVQRLRADEHRRLVQTRVPVVVTPHPALQDSTDYVLKPIKGTALLFWARPGTPLIGMLEKAYATGDERVLRQLSEEFQEQLDTRPVQPIDVAFEKLLSAPVYFDVMYGSKTLVASLALVDGIDYGVVTFAYNGGKLHDADFKIVERYRDFDRASYDTLIVKTAPDLSAVEQQAIDAVPEHQLELNVAHTAMCPIACAGIAAIVIALITCAGGCSQQLGERLDEVELTEEQIKQLGSLASARDLLSMRREILEEFGV
ncbi:hypothetical protein [Streptomyces torulosus]|uniref:hypothetical protein n=1 Tax=Streptomyces torulosus TaxID=68276 RepID=UPI0006EB58AE|nr:hypothetical protein [Streptomyces torulosus]